MKYMNHNNIKIALFLVLAVSLYSCKTKKSVLDANAKIEKKTQQNLLSDIQQKEIQYKDISGKISCAVILPGGSKNTKKVGGVVKIIKDQAFQISFRMFGIEGFRVTMTPDSIYIIDRLNKNYAVEDIKNLQKSMSFSYGNLQALLTNAIFLPGKSKVTEADYPLYTIAMSPDSYLISTKSNKAMYNFAVDGNDRIISTLIYKPESKDAIQFTYSNFIADGARIYPTEIRTKVELYDNRFDLALLYDKLDFDQNISIDYSLPTKYSKVSIKEIIKTYLK